MNIYDAIMKAADQIERQPERFSFSASGAPGIGSENQDCGTPGCALGWIAHFYYAEGYTGTAFSVPDIYVGYGAGLEALGLPAGFLDGDFRFYDRMDALVDEWRYNAAKCAQGLCLYAEKYHGDEKPKVGIPQSVLDIFTEKQAVV